MTIRVDKLPLQYDFKIEPFFELSHDLLCIAGFDGYFKKVNPAVCRVLGYTADELMAKPINQFVYSADQHITEQHRNNLRKNTPLLNFENRYVTKTGEIVWLSWTSIPAKDEQLVYAIAKDITAKKRMEEERNALLANLTRINTDLKQINYTTSHDLRSPVNNLLSTFDMLDVSKINDIEIHNLINILKLTVDNLKETLNKQIEVLNQREDLVVNTEALNLNTSLNVVLQSINKLIHDSKATFTIDFSAFDTIIFNKAYLESIFLNLITNAIKYARADCLPLISIYSRETNGVKQLVFSDNGQGFDMNKVGDKIFGLNQTFHGHADSKGIGLYLVYNHVVGLGGHISVESNVNAGTTFIISFKS
ncbi:PAS domain S-box protein [Pedobacter sp. BS3]|uniref:sensor histidine kinase n=1 Tax=Pedobacter sp. BS3 TaxID=2567937 RepID=UPI0011EE491B|nr:PAS domain-containing sensor histidine kinase [Pedobacter sp. BS3]TZF82149.1 PAS domain S-box protein [Pedobacter sp. BS3]